MQEEKKTGTRILKRYIAVTAFCLIVSVIYDHFSHGIHSGWMRYLALWPFVLGTLPAILMAAGRFPLRGTDKSAGQGIGRDLYRFGISAVTTASFLKGVLEIAGTDSIYPNILLYAGLAMLAGGAAGLLFLYAAAVRRQ